MTPTQRSLDLLRKEGYLAAVVEKFNHYAGPPDAQCPVCGKNRIGVRQDLFGVFDIIATGRGQTIAVQTTSGSNLAIRRVKLLESAAAMHCKNMGGWQIEIHGWVKRERKGERVHYECRREIL